MMVHSDERGYLPLKWYNPNSHYPAWSTDQAEQILQESHTEAFSKARILQALIIVQQAFGHVSEPAQTWLSRKTGVHIADIRSLIEFYQFLEDHVPVHFHLRFASNIVEQHAGLEPILAQVRAQLCGVNCIIETTSCIGLSDHPVSVLVNGFPVTRLGQDNVDEFCHLIKTDTPLQNWPSTWFGVNNIIRHPGQLTAYPYIASKALNNARSMTRENIINKIGDAGLRGLGGAGFPTAFKWHWCEQQADPVRYIVCNADEGEPGTFKDRFYLSQQLDRVIEGMAIAALAVGAQKGYLYLRGEYLYLYEKITTTLQAWRQQGDLGSDFDIELHLGAGAYICGEESALIESLEGKRGIPTSKPPFPGEKGLFGKPTVVNNVETFAAVTYIMQEGADDFSATGTAQSKGSRLHSVSGDCEQPGLYELAQGTALAELLGLCGATNTQCVQVGGPSGQLLFPQQFNTRLDFENPGHGGSIMIFNQHRSVLDITRNFSEFFRHESCGFCTPCRAGTVALCNLLSRLPDASRQPPVRSEDLIELADLMNQTSHCGLGKTAGAPVLSYLKWRDRHE